MAASGQQFARGIAHRAIGVGERLRDGLASSSGRACRAAAWRPAGGRRPATRLPPSDRPRGHRRPWRRRRDRYAPPGRRRGTGPAARSRRAGPAEIVETVEGIRALAVAGELERVEIAAARGLLVLQLVNSRSPARRPTPATISSAASRIHPQLRVRASVIWSWRTSSSTSLKMSAMADLVRNRASDPQGSLAAPSGGVRMDAAAG